MRLFLLLALGLLYVGALCAAPELTPRTLKPEDYAQLRGVEGPTLSPDGQEVAYVVKTVDLKPDKTVTNLWMAKWDGSHNRALTFADRGVTHPRFSPDGKWIAFLCTRDDENDVDQVWLLPLTGGESEKLTSVKGGVDDFAWSPDSKRLVLVVHDPEVKQAQSKPIVLDRYRFKNDGDGYLTRRYSHLQLIDLKDRKPEVMTSGEFNDILPAWSPDGKYIAFVSKRGNDPDRTANYDVYVIEAKSGAKERQLTTSIEADASPLWGSPPAWSPDSKHIAYLHGGDPKKLEYATHSLAVISLNGGEPRMLTKQLDRNLYYPQWSVHGDAIFALIEDDGSQNLVKIGARSGSLKYVTQGRRTVTSFDVGPHDQVALRMSTSDTPEEIYAIHSGDVRDLSKQNAEFRKQFKIAKTEETSFKSADGTQVHGFIIRPPDTKPGKSPAMLYPHGGPQSQYSNEFLLYPQIIAAAGYTVILPNPRGSTGRGTDYAMGIYANWGSCDVEDDLAAVDDAIAKGYADPERLVVGGWSYGGFSTNYLVASTTRFKAAISGAGQSNVLAGYGTDEYVYDYETELGVPWENHEAWMRVSYPFLHADRIKTPTMFMCGELDANIPAINSEQMYQALKSLGVPTQLIIYPGQYHAFSKPSFIIDRLKRYLDWYAKWLK